jgi:hypothetical protein
MSFKTPTSGMASYNIKENEWVMLPKAINENYSRLPSDMSSSKFWNLLGYDSDKKASVVAEIDYLLNNVFNGLYKQYNDIPSFDADANLRTANWKNKIDTMLGSIDAEKKRVIKESYEQICIDIGRTNVSNNDINPKILLVNQFIKLCMLCVFLFSKYDWSYTQGDNFFLSKILYTVHKMNTPQNEQIALAYIITKKLLWDLNLQRLIPWTSEHSGINRFNYPIIKYIRCIFLLSLIKFSRGKRMKKFYNDNLQTTLDFINNPQIITTIMDQGSPLFDVDTNSYIDILKKTFEENNILYYLCSICGYWCEHFTMKRILSARNTQLGSIVTWDPLDIMMVFTTHQGSGSGPNPRDADTFGYVPSYRYDYGKRIYSLPFPKKRIQKIYNYFTKNDNQILLKIADIVKETKGLNQNIDIQQIIKDPLFKMPQPPPPQSSRPGRCPPCRGDDALSGGGRIKRRKSIKKRRFKLNKTIKLKH